MTGLQLNGRVIKQGSLLTVKAESRTDGVLSWKLNTGYPKLNRYNNKIGQVVVDFIYKVKKIRRCSSGKMVFNVTIESIIKSDSHNSEFESKILHNYRNKYGSLMITSDELQDFDEFINIKSLLDDLDKLEKSFEEG